MMKKALKKTLKGKSLSGNQRDILNEFIDTQNEVKSLPQFSPVEKVKFDHDVSIDHLYYSSKIEGSHLDDKRLNEAIHA